ncbi:uncharacterized protein LOC128897148 [Hylaeus anthracinus]|uniref:uncharacterized protein LOC128897148 n=1 Tax=Hylaeus anthracinus TaxID=313031 RepID=UPI0023B9BD31|nr:uncharacterized protein LOC128897148 [Hylaeus anthracinus]
MNCCTESLEDEDAAMLNAVVLMMAANCSMAFLIALSSSCKVESMSSSIANWYSKGLTTFTKFFARFYTEFTFVAVISITRGVLTVHFKNFKNLSNVCSINIY